MKSMRAATLAISLLLVLVAGCSSKPVPTLPVGASMDGMYAVTFGALTGLAGKPVPNSEAKQTWAIRTSCRENGCVATITAFDGDDPTKPSKYATDLDFVDGHWIGVRETTGPCGDEHNDAFWVAYSLEPKPDGVIAGMRQDLRQRRVFRHPHGDHEAHRRRQSPCEG